MGKQNKSNKAFQNRAPEVTTRCRTGGGRHEKGDAAEPEAEAKSMFGFTTSDRVVLIGSDKEGIVIGFQDYGTVEVKLLKNYGSGGTVEFSPEELKKILVFEVLMLPLKNKETVEVYGDTLGDFRADLQSVFGIPPFEQRVVFTPRDGEPRELVGDDSVLLTECGLIGAEQVILTSVVDPRLKMEKETAFLEALVACRFGEAMAELDSSSGRAIDPNCVHNFRASEGSYSACEAPKEYSFPAISVAMLAGLPVGGFWSQGEKYLEGLHTWLAYEPQVEEVVEFLIRREADVNAMGDEMQSNGSAGATETQGKTPLCWAVQRGSIPLVRRLLQARADPELTCSSSVSAGAPNGPGTWKARDFTQEICNQAVNKRDDKDPRSKYSSEIIALLNEHEESES